MSRRRRLGGLVVALGLLALLCGCASSGVPARFHTLMPPIAGAAASTQPAPGLRVEVLSVALPPQVDVPQIVVRLPDDSMRALEHERWIAPLADEIRAALALRIDAVLADVSPSTAGNAAWRVALDVQRFDSALGGAVSLQGLWSLQPGGGGAALRCRVNDREAVAAGPAALVAGHRTMLQRLGDAIARALRSAAAGDAPACA
jgi:uncharacterized lipoprotein YmbA